MKELTAVLNFFDERSLRKLSITLFDIIEGLETENFHLKEKFRKNNLETQEKYTSERIRADANEIRAESLEILLKKLIDGVLESKGETADEEDSFKEPEADELQGRKKCTD